MAKQYSATVGRSRGLVPRVRVGKLTRRDLLRMFGISATTLGTGVLTGWNPRRFDYIIIGAGSAGCTLAARLLAEGRGRVLLIEAGGSNDRDEVRDFTQSFLLTQPGSPVDWGFESEPQATLEGRSQSYSCGKVLGGSSSINGMVWVRGNPADFDAWAALGCTGWDFASLLPSFAALTGPIHPSNELTSRNALSQAIVQAAMDLGHPFNPDYNGADQHGVAYTQLNVVNGIRQDAFTSFLTPYLGERRLTILIDAHVRRLVFDRSCTIDRLIVEAEGKELSLEVGGEVIVCTGAVNTPWLLQLSGIGAAEDIEPHGIRIVADVPGVGRNLQDHLISVVAKRLRTPEPETHVTAMDVNVFAGQGSPSGTPKFEIQSYYMRYGWGEYPSEGLAFGVINLHPTSRGFIKLRSADPLEPPIIQPNFLSTEEDLANHLEGYKQVRELLNSPGLSGWVVDEEAAPGAGVVTDEQLREAVRHFSEADFHPVGTCRMGVHDDAVVDPRLAVRGVKGLRLASAAIMPTIPSGNTNAPSMMIGDRCARLMLDGC